MILPVRNYGTVTVLKLRPTDDISWLSCFLFCFVCFQINLWDLWSNCSCVSKAFRFLAQTDIVGKKKPNTHNNNNKTHTHTLFALSTAFPLASYCKHFKLSI